jgi:hypothetical protein
MLEIVRSGCVRIVVVVALLLGLQASSAPAAAQGLDELLTLSVSAGYGGRFRGDEWLPLRIEIDNQGSGIQGRLVVRPETSGDGLPSTFSTPVDIAPNTRQSIFLYITARSAANRVRVELMNDAGGVITSREASLRSILPRDRLYVVVTQAMRGAMDLSTIAVGGHEAFQVNWEPRDIPEHAGALTAVDVLLFSDINTGTLTSAQQQAIANWVASGGHLIVTGGAGWQATAAGLAELLPFVPESAETTGSLTALARFAGDYSTTLDGEAILTVGEPVPGARVLVTADDDQPLIVRGKLGSGTIDYVTVDPNGQMLRTWNGLTEMWFTLLTSTDARPSWTYGFANWARAATAVETLPGLNLLPAVLGLIGFLLVYILLIGPINYLVLKRINRREFAWFTIPALIVIFSVLAWMVGFELRGNRASLSRLTVVQTWPDSQTAKVDQLIGLLAPRRGNYSLAMTDDRMLRPFSDSAANATVLGGRLQMNADIRQTNTFEAVEFPVDASFIGSFSATGSTVRPEINGRAVLTYNPQGEYAYSLQGSVRNNSDLTLHDAVILARGETLRLEQPLQPGDVFTFSAADLPLAGEDAPVPSALEFAAGESNPLAAMINVGWRRGRTLYLAEAAQNASDILGEDSYRLAGFNITFQQDTATQEIRRRQAFLDAFVIDQFASTGRGNRVYLAGWAEAAPTIEEVAQMGFDTFDSTLYLIELEVERDDSGDSVLITRDQFTWVSRERQAVGDSGPVNLSLMNDSRAIFRFTPLPDAVLAEVDELVLVLDGARNTLSGESLEMWNWAAQQWEVVAEVGNLSSRVTIANPQRYLGPLNAVEIRSIRTGRGGTVFIERMGIEQRGHF